MDRDDHIKYNLECYLPYIRECVDATHLLIYLNCYSDAERTELNKVSRRDPGEATRRAFEILLKKDSPGLYTSLLRSFEEDNPKIVKLLQGDNVKCDANYMHILESFTQELIEQVEPDDLKDCLLHYRVITNVEAEETRAEFKNHGKIRAAYFLLTNIHKHIEDWFKYFIKALIDTGREDLAKSLDEDMVEKIGIQSEHESANETANTKSIDDMKEHVREEIHEVSRNSKVGNFSVAQTDANAIKVNSGISDSFNIAYNNQKEFCDVKVLNVKKDNTDKPEQKQAPRPNIEITDMKQAQNDVQMVTCYDRTELTNVKLLNVSRDTIETTSLKQVAYQTDAQKKAAGNTDGDFQKEFGDVKVLNVSRDTIENTDLKQAVHQSDVLRKAVENTGGSDRNEIADVKVVNVNRDNIESPDLKQALHQSEANREAVEDTDDESAEDQEDFNDLDRCLPESDTESRNITTDVDEISAVGEHEIELRGYQKKLSQKGSEGENVIIMAPTNSGKTRVACHIVKSVFKRCEEQGKTGKAAFIVDKEELAFQQGKVFEEMLPTYRTKVITGDVQQAKNQHLKEYINRRDVLVITAQVLLNCMKAKEVTDLSVFDIVVFDECHHTDKKHPYKKIMDHYFEQKLINAVNLPQIVGLTASIGVGGKLDKNSAFESMKQIAANLDAMAICTVDEEDKVEMKSYLNDPDESIVTVPRRSSERFYDDLVDTVERIDQFMATNTVIKHLNGDDNFMKTACRVPTKSIGTPRFQSWLSDFKKGLSILTSADARQILSPCLCYLEQYHQAVMMYDDARIKDALNSLQKTVDDRREADYNNDADLFLLKVFDDLQKKSYENEPENPKLIKLQELVLTTIGGNDNARGIIFVKTKALAKVMKKWMHEVDTLKELNARVFVGQNVGMTKRSQRDVLALFKDGKHKIIIATTVAEEGLDIAKCNLVIKYEHVTNEKARVQCRGRARAPGSKYFVLTEKGSNIVEKEEFNARCEKLMEELLPELKNYMERNGNRWEDEIVQMQRNAKEVREAQHRLRLANVTDDIVNLHCGNCGSFICSSEDIKKVSGMHHIVVSSDIREKIVLRQSLKPGHVDDTNGTTLGGDAFCSNRTCIYKHKIGGIMQYKMMDFPVLAIKNICLKNLDGRPLPSARQWSKVGFKVESIDGTDLTMIVNQRLVD